MAFFSPQSEDEKFVREHCIFVHIYLNNRPSVYCCSDNEPHSDVIASGEGETIEDAFTECKERVKRILAYLSTLGECITEVDNSTLARKELIASFMRDKFEADGAGVRL